MQAQEPPMTLHDMRERLAAQSRWESVHRSIVLRRRHDVSYAHIATRHSDGSRVISWDGESALGRELELMFSQARLDFEERFGRKPEPGDLILPSPFSDEPREITLEEWQSMLDKMIDGAREAGLSIGPLLAWRELGYLVTETNIHLFSPKEVKDFLDTMRRHEAENYSNPR